MKRGNEDISIAIIGASYAGLSLANTLKQKSSISFTIFDSKTLPFTYVTGGDAFNVPSYSTLAKKLSLKTSSQLPDNGLTRQDVIESLLEQVTHNVIVGTRIERIEKRNNVFYLHTRTQKLQSSANGSSTETIYGPYQYVIGADGVRSKCRTCALHGIFLIGDARWVNDRWYDLGLRRIEQGADIAIQDGVELGEMFLTAMKMKSEHKEIDCAFKSFSEAMAVRAKYCARQIQIARMTRIISVLVVLFAVAVMKNKSMMQSFLQSLFGRTKMWNLDAFSAVS